MPSFFRSTILLTTLLGVSCTTLYYNFWETLGQEKRDLLKSNISKFKGDQDDVKEEFSDTLEKVRSEYRFDGGNLEKTYDALSSDYESANEKSEDLSNRINKVEDIAGDLFKEWKEEAVQITNQTYRRDSLNKRSESMKKFSGMLRAMRKVETSLSPVLTKLKDQVTYLKHNLNARSLGGFKTEFSKISTEIAKLSSDIEKSSNAADKFIEDMN